MARQSSTVHANTAEGVPGSEHLAFACNGCGDCCRRHRVALTHRDLMRLSRALSVPPTSLVAWLSSDQIDLEAESASLVLLPGGSRLMVLAHEAGACALLDETDRCCAYSARPLDCRLYPFVLEREEDRKVTRLSLFEPDGCGERKEERESLRELERADAVRWAELDAYRSLVARWNRLARHRTRLRHRAHGEPEFLAFLAVGP